jgi:hypothetical protein
MANTGIGQRLFISGPRPTCCGAFGKLGVPDRTAAVTAAIERGDIPPPSPWAAGADLYIPTVY